jgi:hypothetical protein
MEGHVRPIRYPRDAGALQRDTALVIPGRSIGSVAIGMKRSEVLRRYGDPASSRRAKLGPAKAQVLVDTFRMTGGPLRVATANERVISVETASPYYTTLAGLGPGSARAEVARLPAVWHECGKHVQYGARVVTTLELGKRRVSSVGIVRRAYAPECSDEER